MVKHLLGVFRGRGFLILALSALSVFLAGTRSNAQTILGSEFSVQSFRRLDWDLDARSNYPICDQNGKKAAIIKVITSADDLDFDVGVMGVVAVKQEVGEIWVYVPEKVRKITIRHQDFGVIRDYYFPEIIESAVVYEMVLRTPPVLEKEIIVRDSIVYVQDSLYSVRLRRDPIGLVVSGIFSFPDYSAGLMIGWEKHRLGIYLKAVSNFESEKFAYDCLSDGTASYGPIWTTGRSRISQLCITGGLVYRVFDWLDAYAGLGYGKRTLLWEDTSSRWVRVSDFSPEGLASDVGIQFRLGRIRLSAGLSTIAFRTCAVEVGVGVCF